MEFKPSRLRRGEWLVGAGAVALLVLMFAFKWYGPGNITGSTYVNGTVNGWHGLTHVRWLILFTIAVSLSLPVAQATRRAPALPASISVIVPVLALITVLWLGYRVLISIPPHETAAAYVGLASAVAILAGGYLSLREEGIAPDDGPPEIPTVRVRR
jgi:hypothetical protein